VIRHAHSWSFSSRFVLALPLWLCACGGSTPATQGPEAVPSSKTVAPTLATVVEPVAVAAEPADLVAVGRLKSPGPSADKLGEWAGFPLPWQDLLASRFPDLQSLLAVNIPADFAVSLGAGSKSIPEIYGVLSLPLTDHARGVDALKSLGEPVSTDEAGHRYVSLTGSTECTVARANGPAPARLVCGNHESLTQLTPFVVSNLPQQAVGNSDLYAELRLLPIHARYAKRAPLIKMLVPMLLREASLQNPRFDAALADAAHGVTDDVMILINELDKLSLKLDLTEPSQEIVGEIALQFRGNKSFLPAAVSHAAKGPSSAPAAFWSLPATSVAASFTASSEPFQRLSGVTETLGELLAGGLEHAGLASGVVDAWLAEFKSTLNAGGSFVGGHVDDTVDPAKPTLAAAVGCDLFGVEGDNGAVARLIESTVKVANDGKLRAELGKRSSDVKKLPTIGIKAAPARLGLPAGSKLYTLTLPKDASQFLARGHVGSELAKKQGPLTLSLIVVKQDQRTWVGWGANDALLTASLKQVLSGATAGSLSENPAYARWRTAHVVSGATFRINSLIDPNLFSGDDWLAPTEVEQLRQAMPHQGNTYVHAEVTAQEKGPTSAVRLVVPRAAAEDIAAAIVWAATKAPQPTHLESDGGDVEAPVGIKGQ
jgi:hypothetical protein